MYNERDKIYPQQKQLIWVEGELKNKPIEHSYKKSIDAIARHYKRQIMKDIKRLINYIFAEGDKQDHLIMLRNSINNSSIVAKYEMKQFHGRISNQRIHFDTSSNSQTRSN